MLPVQASNTYSSHQLLSGPKTTGAGLAGGAVARRQGTAFAGAPVSNLPGYGLSSCIPAVAAQQQLHLAGGTNFRACCRDPPRECPPQPSCWQCPQPVQAHWPQLPGQQSAEGCACCQRSGPGSGRPHPTAASQESHSALQHGANQHCQTAAKLHTRSHQPPSLTCAAPQAEETLVIVSQSPSQWGVSGCAATEVTGGVRCQVMSGSRAMVQPPHIGSSPGDTVDGQQVPQV